MDTPARISADRGGIKGGVNHTHIGWNKGEESTTPTSVGNKGEESTTPTYHRPILVL